MSSVGNSFILGAHPGNNKGGGMTPFIRPECPADHEAIRRIHRLAFGQDDEAVLVDALRAGGHARLSLVADVDGDVVGHILFSDLPIHTDRGIVPALALAPMAVRPDHQKRGIGSALIRAGLAECRANGHRIVVVLGHAEYYPRFGFSAKLAESLKSPFTGKESWMALELVPGALNDVAGEVEYAPPFGIAPAGRKG
jgi:putative acetyltransferase